MSLRTSMNKDNNAEVLSLISSSVKPGIWKFLFGVVSWSVISMLCFKIFLAKFQHLRSWKQVALTSVIILTPWFISIKALIKMYYQNLGDGEDTVLETVMELLGAVTLLSFWGLIEDSNRARAQAVAGYKRLLFGVCQYLGVRSCLSVFILVMLHLELYRGVWLKVSVWVILCLSEVVSLGCLTKFGLVVAERDMKVMFFVYKVYKYAVWAQEFAVFVLGYLSLLDVPKGVLYAAVMIEMIMVCFLQWYYRN